MKNRIKEYIDLIFADAPSCARTREMKEEMYANVCDRYDDLIKEGKSESAAYNISISGIGDISELIQDIKNEIGQEKKDFDTKSGFEEIKTERVFTQAEKEEIERYRVRRGIMNSVAIALYIVCWLPLVIIASLTEMAGGNVDVASMIGLCIMMLMIVAATVLMIMKSSIKPLCIKVVKESEINIDDDDDDDDDDDGDGEKKRSVKLRRNPALSAISSCLWVLATCAFFLCGFLLGAWHPGWILFIIAIAIDNIVEAIFELAGKKYLQRAERRQK